MAATLWRIAWRSALCLAISWGAWRLAGPVIMVCTLPLFGAALARPLIELASDLKHAMRVAVWHADEGRHYAFHGKPVQVIEDAEHVRWVRAADVRTIVGFTASDGALALTYPEGWRLLGTPAQPHFSDTALLAHLRKERSAEAIRFANWVEHTIAFPAQRLRRKRRAGDRPGPANEP